MCRACVDVSGCECGCGCECGVECLIVSVGVSAVGVGAAVEDDSLRRIRRERVRENLPSTVHGTHMLTAIPSSHSPTRSLSNSLVRRNFEHSLITYRCDTRINELRPTVQSFE
jgi:hypothetical protein